MAYNPNNPNGQATMANSQPVTVASDQSAVPVSAASLPLPSGAATSAKQPALGTAGTPSSDVISVQGVVSGTPQPVSASSLPLPTGASTAAKQPALGTAGTASSDVITVQGIASMTALKTDGSAVTQPVSAASLPLPTGAAADSTLSTTNTRIGDVTETAPASDTASSGLNGRLQRVAQRLTSLIALLPTALTGSGNFKVALVESTASQAVTGAIKDTFASISSFTITLASLASSTSGVGRQSTLIDNTANRYSSAVVSLKITVGTTPTANSLIYVYLIRSDNNGTPIVDDGGGSSDAGITITNAPLLGTILVPAATSNTAYYGIFDTKALGSLGPKWGIAVVNSSGVALNATGGNHVASYIGVTQSVA